MKEFSVQQQLTWVTRLLDFIITALGNLTSVSAGTTLLAET